MNDRIDLPERPRILVIALRRLGDVLLTTPLIRSLRRAWPDATIDALVFANTQGILIGNEDIDRIITMPNGPSALQGLALAARLFRRYDLSVSTQTGDRPATFAILSARRSVSLVEPTLIGRLKAALLYRSSRWMPGQHRVEENLRLADLVGIERVGEIVCPNGSQTPPTAGKAYAVIHAAPMYRYKQWTREGWRAIASALLRRGLTVIATGAPTESERHYLDEVWNGTAVERLDGKLDWSTLSGLLASARIYVGPDTSVTHLAAASGCPTIAIYGPTDPRQWGPWPKGGLDRPWKPARRLQQRGNVWLVQNPLPCLPCQLEGCERRVESHSVCLDELSADQVLAAVEDAFSAR
jgi:heptosyltransferase-3